MSVLDIVNNIKITYLDSVLVSSNGTQFSNPINITNYDGGFFLVAIINDFTGGSSILTLQESDESGSGFVDVPANKLIDPNGTGEIVLNGATPPLEPLAKLGGFSTKRFIRFKIVSTGIVGNNVYEIIATRNPEIKPDITDTIWYK